MICDLSHINLPRSPEYLDLLAIRVNNVLGVSSILKRGTLLHSEALLHHI